MQTLREVVDSLLRRQPADRVRLTDSVWHGTVRKWVTLGSSIIPARQRSSGTASGRCDNRWRMGYNSTAPN